MNQYPEIQKVLTENSLIDEIIYECRQILKGIVVKDQYQADQNETVRSLKEADLYHDIQMGTDIFTNYTYTYELLMKLPSMSPLRAIEFARDNSSIPDGLKVELQRLAREEWLSGYEDTNEYFRLLSGLPKLGDEYIYLTDEEYNMIPIESYDRSKPVHLATVSEASLLYTSGVIDSMKDRYPDAKYLDHLGERSIDPYIARRTPQFGLLYLPPIDSPEITRKWIERFEINRVYLLKTIYSEAYNYNSDYYDRFMIMLIIIMTLDDMIVYSPEYIISRDLFDLRTIQYLFEASGVEFFPEIPLKYQKRLIKNLNRLIKYKSSSKCMVDIVSLFGYDNMQLFKYYLMKVPVINEDGSYRKDTYTNPDTGKEELDLESNYDLKFLKVPIGDIADDYINDPFSYEDYDETADNDIYWNGVYTKEYVKKEILKHEFDLHISKYISVDTVYSLTELQFQMVYFMNMLLYSKVDTDMLTIDVPEINSNGNFKLTDLIIMLFALSYMYQGIKDSIIYDPIQAIAILGFNFNTDLVQLSQYVQDQGFTLEKLGLDKFINPNPIGIRSWEELDMVYTNNREVYNNLVYLMNNANNYDEYVVYRKVYDSLYVTRLNFDLFRQANINNVAPRTYTDYLKNSNIGLYNVLLNCEAIQKESEKQLEISRVINFIVEDIHVYLDKDEFRFIFNGLPTVNMDYIRKYIFDILNFFKSYKVDVIDTNTIYKFEDRMDSKIRILDKIMFGYVFNKSDKISMSDVIKLLSNLNWKEDMGIIERLYRDITYWKEKHCLDKIIMDDKDRWKKVYIYFTFIEYINIKDSISINYLYNWAYVVHVLESLFLTTNINEKDSVAIEEALYLTPVYDSDPTT